MVEAWVERSATLAKIKSSFGKNSFVDQAASRQSRASIVLMKREVILTVLLDVKAPVMSDHNEGSLDSSR